MRDTKACRACLNTEDRLVRIPDTWYRMFETLTGLQATKIDGYPNYFCVECKSHIHKAITFRKKSRRAFYILKEIMMVRKEVNLPDILTVDRSRVSLDSSLGNFRPKRSAIYSLCTSEEGSSDLVKEDLNMVNSSAVIDIKGEMGEFPEEVPETPPMLEDDHPADLGTDIPDDNIEDNVQDLEEKEPEPEIDMNDIFKGLKEPESENSDEEDKPAEKKKKKKRKKGEPKVVKVKKEFNKYSLGIKARSLLNYDVKELTEDEQKEVFKKRISNPNFTQALYTCGICVKFMPNVTALMAHFDIHIKKSAGEHICKICKDKFMTAEDYDLHTKEYHLYQYTCKICEEVVYSIRDTVKHKKEKHVERYKPKEPVPDALSRFNVIDYEAEIHDKFLLVPLSEEDKVTLFKQSVGVGKFPCDICGVGLPTASQRQAHWLMHVKKPKNPITTVKLQCGVCGVWCWMATGLAKHMEAFHDYKYHCKLCSYEASNRYLAVDHLTRKHSEFNKCRICGFTSRTPTGLDFHIRGRHESLFRRNHCVVCGLGFKAQYSLYVHQFKEHAFFKIAEPPKEGAENACTHCNVQFLSTKAYHNHLVKAEHEEAKDLPWKCLPCRKLFDSEAEFRSHVAESCKHNKPPTIKYPAPCHVCGEMMKTQLTHHYHCMKMHPGVIVLNSMRKLCEMCGKTYKRNSYPVHECYNIAKYKCAVCDIVFHRPTSVVFHVLKKHMKQPFSCNICDQKFRRRYDCKDHILKVHAPVKPYSCPICNREFSHIDFLKEHAKDLHDVHVKLDVKVPKKKYSMFIYPNMKVDLSLIDKSIVDDVKFEVADYTDQIFEVLRDYSDYVITSEDIRRKLEEEGQDYKEFLSRHQDIEREEPGTSSSRKKTLSAVKKTPSAVKKTKKLANRDLIFGDEDHERERGQDNKEFLISNQGIQREEPGTSSSLKKTSAVTKKTKKQAYRDFIFGDDDQESTRTQQSFISFNIDEGNQAARALTHQKFKNDYKFIISDDVQETARTNDSKFITDEGVQSARTSQKFNFIIREDVSRVGGHSAKDYRDFIISREDIRRRRDQSGASPRKKMKYDSFEQEF